MGNANRIAVIAGALALSTSAHATCYTVSWDQLTMSILSPIPAEETKLVPCYVCGGGAPPITSPLVPPVVELLPPPYTPPSVIEPPSYIVPPIIPAPVPEPSTWLLFAIGMAAISFSMFRQRVATVSRK